ncbi:prepilin peptidase [Phaeacidiphilus oryzae]|uniref:prepilin peptidase n=1 Tax=Phaeacidiphilus oryzae TaxID=348818 RepID=UPI00068CA96D|nr:A24 family peptidase [Phaeacidiphilus oryzae]
MASGLWAWHDLGLLWGAGFALPAAVIDLRERRLPDRLTLPGALGTLVLLGAAGALGDRSGSAVRALIAAGVLGIAFWAVALVAPMGLGDAKLALTLGAALGWYGWGAVLVGVFVGFLLAGVAGLLLVAAGRARLGDPIPFGPFLVAGTALAVALASSH